MLKKKFIVMLVISFVILLVGSSVHAENDFPTKAIVVVNPFGPGGGTDLILRPITAVASEYLGQPLVIEYKPGAGGVTALMEVSKAEPDGYTLIMVSFSGLLVAPHVQDLPYTFDDFEPIAQVVTEEFFLAVSADSHWSTIDEFIEEALDHDLESIKIGHAGALCPQHITIEIFRQEYNANVAPVAFEGGAAALSALLGGHIDATIDFKTVLMPQVEAGQLKILASLGDKRDEILDVPTFMEKGYEKINISNWKGFHAPKGVPESRIKTLEKAFEQISQDESYKAMVEKIGGNIDFRNTDDFKFYLEELNQRYKIIIEDLLTKN